MSKRYQPPGSTRDVCGYSETSFKLSADCHDRDLDVTKRDRFELLSAYLDGEVSPEERRLVTVWLDKDPETQCLYRRLLQLRQGFRGLSREHWQPTASSCDTANRVVRKLNHRFRMTCMAGMTAVAVAVIGAFSGALQPMERMGLGTLSASDGGDGLEIALDQPPIAIPKPAMTPTALPTELLLPGADQSEFDEAAL